MEYVDIRVKNLIVHVHSTDEGVVVDIQSALDESRESIASTYAFFTERDADLPPKESTQ